MQGMSSNQLSKTPVRSNLYAAEVNRFRKYLHNTIVSKISQFNFAATPLIIEKVKRSFLWFVLNIETSRSLRTVEDIKEAIKKVKAYDLASCSANIQKMYNSFQPADFQRLTSKQRNKLIAIMRHSLKMDDVAIHTYISKTPGIDRSDWIGNLTINEANILIKRVEKWETKELTGGRK